MAYKNLDNSKIKEIVKINATVKDVLFQSMENYADHALDTKQVNTIIKKTKEIKKLISTDSADTEAATQGVEELKTIVEDFSK